MAEYIEREAAIEAIMYEQPDAHYPQWYADKIKAITSADVAPVRHGKWELSKNYVGYCSCSLCSDCYVEPEWVDRLHWRFCPNCGARMDLGGGKNDTTDI